MNRINIKRGKNVMKTMAAIALVGMSVAGCVDMDLSPNGKLKISLTYLES